MNIHHVSCRKHASFDPHYIFHAFWLRSLRFDVSAAPAQLPDQLRPFSPTTSCVTAKTASARARGVHREAFFPWHRIRLVSTFGSAAPTANITPTVGNFYRWLLRAPNFPLVVTKQTERRMLKPTADPKSFAVLAFPRCTGMNMKSFSSFFWSS